MTSFTITNAYDANLLFKLMNPYGTRDGRKQAYGYKQKQRIVELRVLMQTVYRGNLR